MMKTSRKRVERVFQRPKHSNRIEHKPKTVENIIDETGALPCEKGIILSEFVDKIANIATHIASGTGVPEKYYRSSRGKDYILDEHGWLHLHLDGDVLLLCEQTSDKVIFIMLASHNIFDERPRAKSVLKYLSQIQALKEAQSEKPKDED